MNIKVGIFPQRELHLPILLPVMVELQNLGVECEIVYLPFRPAERPIPEEGLKPQTIEDLSRRYKLREFQWNLKFDLTLSADFVQEYTESWGPQCCLGHGTISKNIYFLHEEICWRESFHDLLVVPGQAYLDNFKGSVHTQIKPWGFPKFDNLKNSLKEETLLRQSFKEQHGVIEERIILFAPTFNEEFQSMDFIWQEIQYLLTLPIRLIVKLHGAASPTWQQKYQDLASTEQKVIYWHSPDISDAMIISDLMISDLSSVCLEYYLTSKPLLVYNNPKQSQSESYHPEGMEFQYRQGAYEFQSSNDFRKQLAQALDHDTKLFQRAKLAAQLFPSLKNSSSKVIAEGILVLAQRGRLKASVTHPLLIQFHFDIAREMSIVEDLIQKAYFPVNIYDDNISQSIKSHLSKYTQINWVKNIQINSPDILHLNQACLFPWKWDFKWQVSQHYQKVQGKVYFLNKENIRPVLGMDFTPDEAHRQRFLSYRGFPKFFPNQGLKSLNFIETYPWLEPAEFTELFWAGLYEIKTSV